MGENYKIRAKCNDMIDITATLIVKEQQTRDKCTKTIEECNQDIIKLQTELRKILDKFQTTIKEFENAVSEQKTIVKVLKSFSLESHNEIPQCEKVAQEYNAYQLQTSKAQNKMSNVIKQKWDSLEQIWWNWDYDDIILWFKYKLGYLETETQHGRDNNNNNNSPNFWQIRRNLVSQRTMGERISLLHKDDLCKLGFKLVDDQKTLRKAIKNLGKKYPKPSDSDTDENCDENDVSINYGGNGQLDMDSECKESNAQSIGEKYTCPLTKTVFLNPVVAANSVIYEKEAIIEWLRKYDKYPDSEKIVKDVEHEISLLFDAVQLKEEIRNNRIGDVTHDD